MNWARDVWPSERARLMSGHMMPTEREAATVEELESWFDDELRCESGHSAPLNRECSVVVTHRVFDCSVPDGIVGCARCAEYVIVFGSEATCKQCGRNATDCWRAVPI